jgi:hypothetical protein
MAVNKNLGLLALRISVHHRAAPKITTGIEMNTLYSMRRLGNSYKVRLALAQLQIPYRLVEVDILRGESRTPEFLAKNPSGQVPLLEVASGRYIAESNAILCYAAGGSALAAEDRVTRAEVLQWMFFEQHSIQPNIGAAYFWLALTRAVVNYNSTRWMTGWKRDTVRCVSWTITSRTTAISRPTATASRTSRSTPIPISRTRAISI